MKTDVKQRIRSLVVLLDIYLNSFHPSMCRLHRVCKLNTLPLGCRSTTTRLYIG